MDTIEKLNIGIAGVCGRGAAYKAICESMPGVRVHAVCDTNPDALAEAAGSDGVILRYGRFDDMLGAPGLDAVIVGTPMHLHVPQSIAALQHGLHVLSEVAAAVSMEECESLVRTACGSKGVYMLAENYTHMLPNAMIDEMVRRGMFGTPYYAEAEYLHEIREYAVKTPWRRKWQLGIDGITYASHSLGPILRWMRGDRITRVCCEGTGTRHNDAEGNPFCQASSTMLGKTANGALVKVRVDLLSDRPEAATNYQLQGTDGAYESARADGERNRVWLRRLSADPREWMDLEKLKDEFLPDRWRNHHDRAMTTGHGGSDYFVILEFLDRIIRPPASPVGIHEAMDMTLPGLCSQESIRRDGEWIEVPDSRGWVTDDGQ